MDNIPWAIFLNDYLGGTPLSNPHANFMIEDMPLEFSKLHFPHQLGDGPVSFIE